MAFRRTYLSSVLPAQLSKGNLPALAALGARYRIFSTAADIAHIRQQPCFLALQDCLPVDLVRIDDLDLTDKYQAMRTIQGRQILDAAADDAALVFLPPDTIYSNGAFLPVVEALRGGKRALMVHELRVDAEAVAAELTGNTAGEDTLSARKLATIALNHLHPQVRFLMEGEEDLLAAPGHLYWRTGAKDLLVRSFHLHPLLVWPTRPGVVPSGMIDFDFTARACPDIDTIEVVTDSDRVCACQLTSRAEAGAQAEASPALGSRAASVALWTGLMTTRHHRMFFRHAIWLHAGDDRTGRADAERRARHFARRVSLWRTWFELLHHSPVRWLHRLAERVGLDAVAARMSWATGVSRALGLSAFLRYERYALDRDVTE